MKCNYVTRTREGKVLLSSTMYIKNDDGQALGALCINTDISERIKIKEYLDSSLPEELNKKDSNEEFFATDVSDLLVYLIDQGINNIGRPVSEMTKEDKMKVITFSGLIEELFSSVNPVQKSVRFWRSPSLPCITIWMKYVNVKSPFKK